MSIMVSERHGRRYGTCGWCGRHNQKLTYTVSVEHGEYHASCVCQRCLDEYRENLGNQLRKEWEELVGSEE